MVRPLTLLAVAALLFTSACSDNNDTPADTPEKTNTLPSTEQTSEAGSSPSTVIAGEPADATSEDSLYLRYNKGEKYRYRVKQTSTSTQDTVSGTETSSHIYTKEVLGVDATGNYMVNMTFSEIQMGLSMKSNVSGVVGMQEQFDSRKKADLEKPANNQWTYILNTPVQVNFSKAGEVRGVEGVRPIVEKVIQNAPNISQVTPQQITMVKQQVEQQISVGLFAAIGQQEFVPYPDDLLLKGNTWTKSIKSSLGAMFMLSGVTRYEITDISEVNGRRVATVKAVMNGDIEPQPQVAQAGMSFKITKSEISGTSTSKIFLDNGVTITRKSKQSTNIAAEVTPAQTGKTETVSMKRETRYEVKLLK